MELHYKGGNAVIITTKKTTLQIDPKISPLGLKDPSVTDGIELATSESGIVDGARLTIDGPGEYEVGDFSIRAVGARRHVDGPDARMASTIYHLETIDFRVGVIGNVEAKLSDDQLEAIGVIDILIIPVGGNGFTLDPHDAAAIARQIDPKVVIPVHYQDEKLAYEVPQLPLEQFTRELNLPVEMVDRYKIKNAAALPEALSIVAINRT